MGVVQPDCFRLRRHPEGPIIGAFDCTFLPKSGTETWGLGQFFSSLAGKPRKGLEVSVLGIVATSSGRAFGVDATQTPSDLPKREENEYTPAWTFTLSRLMRWAVCQISPMSACSQQWRAASTLGVTSGSCF